VPLLGTGLRAAPYPALLWNGARLHREGAPDDDGLVLVALASSAGEATGSDVERAVATGLAVAAGLPDVIGSGPLTGRPTVGVPSVGVVAAAACAAVAAGAETSELGPVLDVAASLMVVQPPVGGSPRQAGLRAGHCLAAGWLAPQLLGAGLIGMAGALAHTVATVTGRPAGDLRIGLPAGAPAGTGARAGSRAGDLLAGLA
jgi:hypothetical protein